MVQSMSRIRSSIQLAVRAGLVENSGVSAQAGLPMASTSRSQCTSIGAGIVT